MKEIKLGHNLVEFYDKPISGRLFVVGDLHGCYTLLMKRLKDIEFDFQHDLLISVGDLIDRGNENLECLSLLDESWFKAIRGNHEQMCIEANIDVEMKDIHSYHGGAWLYELPIYQQQTVVEKCCNLPIILELHHNHKIYGFIHADIHINDWHEFKQEVLKKNYFIGGEQSLCKLHYGIEGVFVPINVTLTIRWLLELMKFILVIQLSKNLFSVRIVSL